MIIAIIVFEGFSDQNKGKEEKAKLTLDFIRINTQEYDTLKQEMESLKQEAKNMDGDLL